MDPRFPMPLKSFFPLWAWLQLKITPTHFETTVLLRNCAILGAQGWPNDSLAPMISSPHELHAERMKTSPKQASIIDVLFNWLYSASLCMFGIIDDGIKGEIVMRCIFRQTLNSHVFCMYFSFRDWSACGAVQSTVVRGQQFDGFQACRLGSRRMGCRNRTTDFRLDTFWEVYKKCIFLFEIKNDHSSASWTDPPCVISY